ncbi:MAG TPA: ATP-binding protein [Polyangiaceae bacterium]|jgi:signal transduction histidine kinase/CheY-like chemotaxis protein
MPPARKSTPRTSAKRLGDRAAVVENMSTPVVSLDEPVLADRIAAIATLAAGAAHQLNAPLTSATINVEHVLRELRIVLSQGIPWVEGPRAQEAVERLSGLLDSLLEALDGMSRIRDTVRNLLIFSRDTVEPRALVDIRSVVESCIQMALHEIEPRARLVRTLAEVPQVEANQAQLGQAFLNLMVNAAQAIPEAADQRAHEIRIATYTDDDGNAVVEVSDDGVGIPRDVLPRVFDPFFTSRGQADAKGLGLSMSLGTLRALGGNIAVSSEPGGFTVFRAVMPPAKGWRASVAPAGDGAGPERTRMLVVDDHRYVGEALERALSDLADVESTTDARAVVDRLGSGERWDVILCDLFMPDTSGMDLYREALRVAPDAASTIVFMTAGAFSPRARAFLEGVANPCLEKPLDMGKLRSLVTRAGSRRVSVSA